jgi:hypothetical protein
MERHGSSQPSPQIGQENSQELAGQMNRPPRTKSARFANESAPDERNDPQGTHHRKRLRSVKAAPDLVSLPRDIVRYLHSILACGRPELARRTVCILRLVSRSWLRMARALPIISKPLTYETPDELSIALQNFNLVEIDLSCWYWARSGYVPAFTSQFQDLSKLNVPYCNPRLLTWLSNLVMISITPR